MNVSKMRKYALIAFVLVMALSIAACGSGKNDTIGTNSTNNAANNNTDQPKEDKTVDPVKLRIMWWGSQTRHDATIKALDEYTKLNPHVTFEPEFSGWDGYWDKLSTQAAANNAPDIIQMDAAYLADYAARNQLTELTTVNLASIDEVLLNSGKVQDKLYAVALGNNAFGLAYNKEAIEKSGIAVPQNGLTWEQYFQFGRDVKAKLGDGQYALMDDSKALDMYSLYQMSKGKGYYVTDDGKFNIDKDTWLEWQNIFLKLREEGVVPPATLSVTDKELDPNLDLMAQGKVVIRGLHAAQSVALDTLKPGAMGMVTLPRGEHGAGWLKPSMFWSVASSSKYQIEAQKFIDWFINDQGAADILTTTRGVPVSKTVLDYMEPKLSPADIMGIDLIKNTAPIAQPFKTSPKGWSNFGGKDYGTIAEKLMFNQISPEQAWEEVVKKAKEYGI
ncbi:extracellular solute-binding protein [Paenibacillus alkaliterrae]|uniref:ABC transporter substrate-binding protein n=1 Tax=Paenibacillus alkaliterrae TaxID=320909 RepID=UPI001F449776|nr:extracellular solute-binding protein [Paenibacillus alkaliterrae]MCF2940899.1 extracellular solute-binding protein [Paenibacillus alkaliterrae]